MKVLITFNNIDTDNLFVYTLYNKIKEEGIDIECSLEKFWNSNTIYDVIHFQWPEEVVGWNCTDPSKIEKLKKQIEFFKQRGTRFVYTRHNTRPHYSNKIINEAYQVIESNSTIIVHMGKNSLEEYKTKYPYSQNIIIPHHIYENIYNELIPQQEARKKLRIPINKFVITAFGKFRNSEERVMVLKAFLKLKIKDKYLLAPRFFPFQKTPLHSNLFKKYISKIAYHVLIPICKLFNFNGKGVDDLVSQDDLPYYLSSSDVIFIQRIHILNSGNIPMAFLFKKIVVGPNVGNVGELLRETGNPTFDPNNTNTIVEAIRKAKKLYTQNQGEENYKYAIKHMNMESIAKQYIEVYTKSFD